MLNKLKNNKKTVAEKVAELITHHNQCDNDSDSADEATAAKVIEYNDDEYELPLAQTTEIRKRNVKLLSEQNEKYKGKVVSRKDFESDQSEDDEEFENSNSSVDQDEFAAFNNDLKVLSNQQDRYSESENEKESNYSGDYDDNSDFESEIEDEENEIIRKVNHEAELQKGLCVQNQLQIWERLLEIRINLQKVLNKTNHLPPLHELTDLGKFPNYEEIKGKTCKQTSVLLQHLLSLKNKLSVQFPEVEQKMKPCLKRPLPFKDNNLEEPSLKQVNQYLEDSFKLFSPYRNDILLKWDDRTKLLQPGARSERKCFSEEYNVTKKIENALVNKTHMIAKSQQIKASAQNGTQQEGKQNPNIYDDSDFYHQQLRELIEYKANTTSNMSEVTKQFLELQKLRQKMKKKVDTRASKGRKLRYIVHNKLINFMAPHENYAWTMESTDELSKSLFR